MWVCVCVCVCVCRGGGGRAGNAFQKRDMTGKNSSSQGLALIHYFLKSSLNPRKLSSPLLSSHILDFGSLHVSKTCIIYLRFMYLRFGFQISIGSGTSESLELNSGFQSPGFWIPQANISPILSHWVIWCCIFRFPNLRTS